MDLRHSHAALAPSGRRGRRASRVRIALAAACAAVAAALIGAPAAAAVPAGLDLFETDPAATKLRLRQQLTIPPDFFAPGSQPFEGDVHMGGVPLVRFQGRDVGDADTIVRRTEDADVPDPGSTDTVPIELVELSLVSTQPIRVKVGDDVQLWDLRAAPSPTLPSTGQMEITRTSRRGGTFSSFFDVFTELTFERRSDGERRTLDMGELPLPQQVQLKLRLHAEDVPWRDGCAGPALRLRGLNDGFCPGLTPRGRKRLTREQAQLAEHGIRPAQPRVEHFKCYAIRPLTRFRPRRVRLIDQFRRTLARVTRPVELCNPVRKNREPLRNREAHLKCYAVRSPRLRRQLVAVRNQFGPDVLRVTRARTLCLPSLKREGRRRRRFPRGVNLTDHFKCYGVRSRGFRRRGVRLRDQFHRERARVLKPVVLCAPVRKNRARVDHPVRHLVCYAIRSRPRLRPRLAWVRNQFGTELVLARRARTLCVPSVKLKLPIPRQPLPQPDRKPAQDQRTPTDKQTSTTDGTTTGEQDSTDQQSPPQEDEQPGGDPPSGPGYP